MPLREGLSVLAPLSVRSACFALGRGQMQSTGRQQSQRVSAGRGLQTRLPPAWQGCRGLGWALGLSHSAELYMKGLVPSDAHSGQGE